MQTRQIWFDHLTHVNRWYFNVYVSIKLVIDTYIVNILAKRFCNFEPGCSRGEMVNVSESGSRFPFSVVSDSSLASFTTITNSHDCNEYGIYQLIDSVYLSENFNKINYVVQTVSSEWYKNV